MFVPIHAFITIPISYKLLRFRFAIQLTIILMLLGCHAKQKKVVSKKEKDRVYQLLKDGNNIYAQRSSINNFAESMRCYDSAVAIAEQYDNDTLKRNPYAAIARAYDAWNKEPEKTILYFAKAIHYAELSKDTTAYVLWRVNLAEAYSKANDSANTIRVINECDAIGAFADSIGVYDDYYTELAYTAANTKNYALALSLSNKVRHPEQLINEDLNFKAHRTLTQCWIHVYYLHTDVNAWMDSVKTTIAHSTNLSDSLYYYKFLIVRYQDLNEQDSVVKYQQAQAKAENKFTNKLDESNTRNAFLEYQIQQSEKEKLIATFERKSILNTSIAIAVIATLSLLITLVIFLSRRKVSAKNKELAELNKQLEEKADENELLLKEMHHRVKNNLSLVYSLLDMQGRKTENVETRNQLMVARNRIESIAMTHEQLYKSQTSATNMNYYLTKIVTACLRSAETEKSIIPLLDIDSTIILTVDKCLPLALLINECITNTVKYAVTDNTPIYITLKATTENNMVTLLYADSGIQPLSNIIHEGFGSKIIRLLSKQLKATLNVRYNNTPFNYKIIFAA